MATNPSRASVSTWARSRRCSNVGDCVEVRRYGTAVWMRSSLRPGTVLAMSDELFAALIAAVKAGDFDAR